MRTTLRLFLVLNLIIVQFSCFSSNMENCFDVNTENFYKEIAYYDGKNVCLSGVAQVGWHGVTFLTNYSGIILPYGGNVYLPISYEEAIDLKLETGDTFSFYGKLEIRQSRTKCENGECYTYYLTKP